jgi:hypothetical protein
VIEVPEIGRANDAKREAAPAIRGWPGNKKNGLARDCGDSGKGANDYSNSSKAGV